MTTDEAAHRGLVRPGSLRLTNRSTSSPPVLDQWYEPSAIYFKVQSTEGKTYLPPYDEDTDEWTLHSGTDAGAIQNIRLAAWSVRGRRKVSRFQDWLQGHTWEGTFRITDPGPKT